MNQEEFIKLCRKYLPNCHFKDEDTCGLCCYNNGDEIHNIVVALLPDGRFAVYDKWRDITETRDLDYVIDWLKHKSQQWGMMIDFLKGVVFIIYVPMIFPGVFLLTQCLCKLYL